MNMIAKVTKAMTKLTKVVYKAMATYRKLKYKKSEKAHDTKSVVSRDFVTRYGVAEPDQVVGKVFVIKGQVWKITRIYKKEKMVAIKRIY